jgi:hypothetical protein
VYSRLKEATQIVCGLKSGGWTYRKNKNPFHRWEVRVRHSESQSGQTRSSKFRGECKQVKTAVQPKFGRVSSAFWGRERKRYREIWADHRAAGVSRPTRSIRRSKSRVRRRRGIFRGSSRYRWSQEANSDRLRAKPWLFGVRGRRRKAGVSHSQNCGREVEHFRPGSD